MSQGVIQGSMREAPLPDVIHLVCQGGKSGCFHVDQDASRARIYLKEGRIIHAVTPAGEGLEGLLGLALWAEGTYRFEEGVPEVPTTITRSNDAILMELGRCTSEWRIISQKVPAVDLFPASTLSPGEQARGISPRERQILAMATGYFTVADLAGVMRTPVIAVAKDLYGLVAAGLVSLKGVRSGSAPRVEEAPPKPTQELVPVSVLLGSGSSAEAGPVLPKSREVEPAAGRYPAPSAVPQSSPPAGSEEPLPETVGGGVAGDALPLEPPKRVPVMDAAQRMAKLMNFTQRIADASRQVLPEHHHAMVHRLHAQATQQLHAGQGPDAVKGLALAISRGAVDAGCNADLVRTLNAQLKALFSSR